MNKYELVYIIDGHASPVAKEEIGKQVNDAMAKCGIKALNAQVWLERHRMSFSINKIMDGTYYTVNVEAPAAALEKLHSLLRINEQVLRFMTVKQEPQKV